MCLLQQKLNKGELLVRYRSRCLSALQTGYSNTAKGMSRCGLDHSYCLAKVVQNIFTLHTDDYALKRILNLADSSGRQARWRLRLAKCDYGVHYRPGTTHELTDGVCLLRRDAEKKDAVDENVFRFVTKAVQPEMHHSTTVVRQ